jgi:hypothetical protein
MGNVVSSYKRMGCSLTSNSQNKDPRLSMISYRGWDLRMLFGNNIDRQDGYRIPYVFWQLSRRRKMI